MFAPPKIKPQQVRDYKLYQAHVNDDSYYDYSTSYGRFSMRVRDWLNHPNGYLNHHGWWLLHNCVAHPALGLVPCQKTVDFHDWTSEKLNQHEYDHNRKSQKSSMPVIPNRLAWIKHNVVAHIAIGLVPCTKTFWYHDVTALDQNVKGWV